MKNVNCYAGNSDSDRIEAAIRDCRGEAVLIPPRVSEKEPERDFWLLDRAILLPENTTVVLENCKLKLSDTCRDNFFRSANCGLGIDEPEKISHIHIRGVGNAVLEGADHPRSTGDSSKRLECPCPKNFSFSGASRPTWGDLHGHTYGTDAGKPEESQYGDWRNIGILMANVDHLSIENLRIVEPHAWAISLESCSHANIHHIEFQACMTRRIDGLDQNNENQDGINLRTGCHDVILSDITGTTGDDVIALTAICSPKRRRPGGSLKSTQVMSNDYTRRGKDIYNVVIRNVLACPAGGCLMLRFLALDGAEIRNVTVDGLVDTSPDDFHTHTGIQIGEGAVGETGYGTQSECSVFHVAFSNILSNAKRAIGVAAGLRNAVFTNVVNRNPEGKIFHAARPELLRDVRFFPPL
ncbi:MAG: hypothetical protein J6A21_04800 [Lentisphaeria bacterium]|nr:hypothetical protein [Lentisphaeria bacterium]